jgi:hypothetical protein
MLRPAPLLVLVIAVSGCGQAEDNPCPLGQSWSRQRERCIGENTPNIGTGGETASAGSAGQGGADPGGPAQGGVAEGGATTAPTSSSAPSSNLGALCTSDAACSSGVATLCLMNPDSPSDPGVCSILNCDSAACGDAFDCCDCSTSATLNTVYPQSLCFPPQGVTIMKSYDCVCT